MAQGRLASSAPGNTLTNLYQTSGSEVASVTLNAAETAGAGATINVGLRNYSQVLTLNANSYTFSPGDNISLYQVVIDGVVDFGALTFGNSGSTLSNTTGVASGKMLSQTSSGTTTTTYYQKIFNTQRLELSNIQNSGSIAVGDTVYGDFQVGVIATTTESGGATTNGALTASQTFTSVSYTYNGANGINAVFDVTTDGSGNVTSVVIQDGGEDYIGTETFTVDGATLGGTSSTDDLTITVATVSSTTPTAFGLVTKVGATYLEIIEDGSATSDFDSAEKIWDSNTKNTAGFYADIQSNTGDRARPYLSLASGSTSYAADPSGSAYAITPNLNAQRSNTIIINLDDVSNNNYNTQIHDTQNGTNTGTGNIITAGVVYKGDAATITQADYENTTTFNAYTTRQIEFTPSNTETTPLFLYVSGQSEFFSADSDDDFGQLTLTANTTATTTVTLFGVSGTWLDTMSVQLLATDGITNVTYTLDSVTIDAQGKVIEWDTANSKLYISLYNVAVPFGGTDVVKDFAGTPANATVNSVADIDDSDWLMKGKALSANTYEKLGGLVLGPDQNIAVQAATGAVAFSLFGFTETV
jgi:hypothetical protein